MSEAQPKVLVVDDELFFREAISEILSSAGYACIEAVDGASAIEAAAQPGVGVVVLDVRLPDIDGIQVLRRLRQEQPRLKVIMLSAHTDQELVLEALRVGACDYLAKPLHDEELTLAVERASENYVAASRYASLAWRAERLADQVELLGRRVQGTSGIERRKVLADAAAGAVSEALGCARASLLLLNEDGDALEVVSAHGAGIPVEQMAPVKPGQGVAGTALEGGEPLAIASIDDDFRFADLADSERYATGSFACAPLRDPETRASIGLVCASERGETDPFGAEDATLLRMLASELARHLHPASEPAPAPAELTTPEFDEGEGGDAELARLVCDACVHEVEPQALMQAALGAVGRALPAVPVSLFLHKGESGALELEGEWDGGERAEREALEVERGVTGAVFASGQLIAATHPEDDPRFDAEIDTPEDGQASPLLCVPLVMRGKVVGVCRAFLSEDAAVSERTGEVLSAALSAAIRNVLLYRSLVESIDEVAEARRAARTQ